MRAYFSSAFILFIIVLVPGCGSDEAQKTKIRQTAAIKRLLDVDLRSKSKMPQDGDYLVLHDWVRLHRKTTEPLDLTECPTAFRDAYKKHRHLWEDIDGYLVKVRQMREAGFLAAMWYVATEDAPGDAKKHNSALKQTWRDVEAAALAYDIQLPVVDVSPFPEF